jgi:fatty-acyl-CoA synthase
MRGLMMDVPLLVSNLIRHADRHHGDTQIVSKRVEGDIHRYTYSEAHARSRRLANVLRKLGLSAGDRVASLAWNGYRHFELYYAVSGSGMVMHTVNPRLFPEQIAWILNDAESKALFIDLTFVALALKQVGPGCKHLRNVVVMTDRAHMPAEAKDWLCYEDLLGPRARTSNGRSSTRTRPAASATRPGPPAIPRVRSTAIARPSCTRTRAACPTRWGFRHVNARCPSCPCSM